MISPGAWAAASVAWIVVRILRDGGFGIRLTGKPSGLRLLPVVCDGLGFLPFDAGIRLALLLGQLPRMHHEKPQILLRHPPITILYLHRPDDALPRPTAARFVLGTPRLFHQERQDGLLAPPGFQFLAHRTGAGHEGYQAQPLFQAQT